MDVKDLCLYSRKKLNENLFHVTKENSAQYLPKTGEMDAKILILDFI
jgi:hypothetical protein